MIELSCHNIKLDSFWAGEWQSTWTVSGGVLSGDLKIRTHYFEMGNSQVNLDKTFDNVKVGDITSAKEVVAAIKKTEDKVSTLWFLMFDSTNWTWTKCTTTSKQTCLRESVEPFR